MAESNFGEKIFLAENGVNMPEIAVFADFVRIFGPTWRSYKLTRVR